MVTRRVSEDFQGFLVNASGYQYTSFKNGSALEKIGIGLLKSISDAKNSPVM